MKDSEDLPGANNMFIAPDIMEKYTRLCDEKVAELCHQFPHIRWSTINEIFNQGFLIGNAFIVEMETEDQLKDMYL